MKMLIIGGNGMAGHLLVRFFQQEGKYRVFYTTRDRSDQEGLLLDASDPHMTEMLVRAVRPDFIVNAAGILNQAADRNKVEAYEVNGLFPHRLRKAADTIGARVIHISTDCVFLGDRGGYSESDEPDGVTVYARSKALGELKEPNHLTIRTSIIGPEIRASCIGLLHWFMQQKGEISGYCRVLWNGVTTLELAKAIKDVAEKPIAGIVHLNNPHPVSKFELLQQFRQVFAKNDVQIVPDDHFQLDRTLVHTRQDFTYQVPGYDVMLQELASWMRSS